MDNTLNTVERMAMELPPGERAHLAKSLISSLEGFDDPDECEQAWLDEAKRRYRDYKAGKIQAIPADEAFSSAFESLK